DGDALARDRRGGVAGEEQNEGGHLLRCLEATLRDVCLMVADYVLARDAEQPAFPVDLALLHSGVHVVSEQRNATALTGHRSNVHDAAAPALIDQLPSGDLARDESTPGVHVK